MEGRAAIRIGQADNVAVALRRLEAGERALGVRLAGPVPPGHKFALRDIPACAAVVKYGHQIGLATRDIPAGAHVHSHNLGTALAGGLAYEYRPVPPRREPLRRGTFPAYRRPGGKIGVRNEVWIVNTVGCVNRTAERLAQEAQVRFAGRTDGVFAFPHPHGCSQLGGDHENTRSILAGLADHPNAGGVLLLGLGCENNTLESFLPLLDGADPARFRVLNAQDTSDEHADGMRMLGELVEHAETFRREPAGLDELVIGLKCGGSDGFSGLTANPLVGRVSDLLAGFGGSAILTEVPEMFGAEELLMNRCGTRELFEETVRLINGFKEYFIGHGQGVGENPSPGNREGGITTLEEKSLGCVQKGGTAPVTGVLRYGERVSSRGLNLLQGPGNDMVAVTALAAAGAHLVLFTTGRGTPLGGPVPTVKISSGSALAARKPGWIDYDAGTLLEGAEMDAAAQGLFDYMLSVASGQAATKNETGGHREIAIFKDGVTL